MPHAHARAHSHCRDLLNHISNVADVDVKNLSSTDLCIRYGTSCFSVATNHHITEPTNVLYNSKERSYTQNDT